MVDQLIFILYFSCPIEKSCRSRMNITFRVGAPDACDILEEKFVSEAASLGMIQLKGHRYSITTLLLFQY